MKTKDIINKKKVSKKFETKYEAFERLNGRTIVTDHLHVEEVKEKKKLPLIITFPFKIISFIIRNFLVGYRNDEIKHLTYGVTTFCVGMCMTTSSILTLIYIKDISKFIKSYELTSDFTIPLMFFITMFSFVQFLRGTAYLGGYDLFNRIEGLAKGSLPGYYRRSYESTSDNIFRGDNRNNIEKFQGYMNSKMSLMSNTQRENYMRDIYGGGNKK